MSSGHGLKKVHDPGHVTGTIHGHCAYRDRGQLPDPRCTPGTELDHLVPVELGGSNDATSLWPEYPPNPNPKDKVENALNHAVCDGRVSLTAAQNAIASDWLTAESKLRLAGGGSGGDGGSR